MTDELTLPPMPDFDPKSTRRAVRRGVFRTAFIVLAALVALVLVATVGSTLVQQRGDRDQRMKDVLGTAFKLYNPAYNLAIDSCCDVTPVSMAFTVRGAPMRAIGGFASYGGSTYTVRQDFFGRVGRLPLGNGANTTLSTALANVTTGNQPKQDTRKVLARLPADLNALAVVEFTRPLSTEELVAFGAKYKACPDKVVYERRPTSIPITWNDATWDRAPMPETHMQMCYESPGNHLRSLRAWVATLRDYDDANLRDFDLSLARLRKAANEGLAYAYVDQLATIGGLRKLIEDPLVRTVRVADVTYDLERP
ncbi:hypothetical protein ABZ297_32970 [Nonomuraea sp. NPDC005983]|uniref:hypothetical protein n=1 Tax=Nonomuraea sp. NPDC005983 TaxID=3155595 RepID=UPI0033A2FC71